MTLPDPHNTQLDSILDTIKGGVRIDAVLGAGSLIWGGFDIHSDLDLVIIVADAEYEAVMAARQTFAASLGELITAFTGEHVGEPRLLICLYGPMLLHVDLKFVRLSDLTHMVERPAILWARDEAAVTATLDRAEIVWPEADAQWFEDRVWTWLHYGATKLHRGELFEAIGMLAFLQERVLGPMLMRRAGRLQRGVRRIEQVPEAGRLQAVHAAYDAVDIARALKAAMALYLDLRADAPPARPAPHMPDAMQAFI
ncbi:hypothetical protein [Asticcacaulis sp. 201]|uniref:hypothetical protein n=1 Tax=Asticcacaulis sp. 201 TaxID=3028787 RepID=UPI002916DA76|nr:hypothetical protein [Asticcacaulis sp. 201]MDV6332979.1 hypothetical protein [Asticcacaulis sp. 201]